MIFHERASWSIVQFEEENKDKIDSYISQTLRKGEFFKEVAQHFLHLKESTAQVIRIQEIPFLLIKKENLKLLGISAIHSSNISTERLRKGNNKQLSFQSEKMKAVMELVRKVSLVDSTVLILGKTGVGKSHIAKLIHQYSQRSNKQLAIVNCSAIPESLIEAELFGYTAGSFTGSHKGGKPGIFQSVSGGTIFLDEIGEVPFHLQSKLLEVIQENSIRPIGSVESIPVDVRIIAATNQDLEGMVEKKLFREDLYYRLNVVPIQIPPLSERKEDLQVLITQFLNTFGDKYEMQKVFTPDVMNAFYQYDWPGNVRELENMIERLFITSEEEVITLNDLPESISNLSNNKLSQKSYSPPFLSLKEAKKRAENALISNAYNVYRNTYKVAEVLQVNQSTIARKVKELREKGEL